MTFEDLMKTVEETQTVMLILHGEAITSTAYMLNTYICTETANADVISVAAEHDVLKVWVKE